MSFDYDSCPDCGSGDITTNTHEAWCTDCTWHITKDDQGFHAYRQADIRHRDRISDTIDEAIKEVLAPITPTAKELRARREALGLSQQQLAAALHVGQSTLAQWESGKRRIPGIRPELAATEGLLQHFTDTAYLTGKRDGQITTYLTDEEWWAEEPLAHDLHLPATLHRVAAARAAAAIRREDITAPIIAIV